MFSYYPVNVNCTFLTFEQVSVQTNSHIQIRIGENNLDPDGLGLQHLQK